MTNPPMVTAIIPLHNHFLWIMDAVKSIEIQDYQNKRLVVIDDGSTDSGHMVLVSQLQQLTSGVVDEMEFKPKYWTGHLENSIMPIYVLRYKEARGPSFARNRGMELLSGDSDIYAFLDSDDLYEQGKITKSVNIFLEYPEVGAVYSDYTTFRNDGIEIREFKEPFSCERLLQDCIVNCDSLVKKDIIKICGGFDQEMRVCEDYDLWMRISEKFPIFHIAESLVRIRTGNHSASTVVSKQTWENNYRRVFEKLRERIK